MFTKLTRPNIEKFLGRYATDKKTLDVGSGGSSYGRFFPSRLTVDIDPERHPEIVADAHALPFEDESFDCVLCTEVLEHTKNPSLVANELMRVLKPGGTLLLTTRFVYPLHDTPGDFFRFTKYGLAEVFKRWSIVEIVPELGDFGSVGALLQRIGFQTTLRGGRFTKFFIYMAALFFSKLDWLVLKEYGDIKKSTEEVNIITTRLYIAVRK